MVLVSWRRFLDSTSLDCMVLTPTSMCRQRPRSLRLILERIQKDCRNSSLSSYKHPYSISLQTDGPVQEDQFNLERYVKACALNGRVVGMKYFVLEGVAYNNELAMPSIKAAPFSFSMVENVEHTICWDEVGASPQLSHVHDVFHVSLLRGYHYHPLHVTSYPFDQIQPDMSLSEEPKSILDRQERVMRNKVIPFVKILWKNHPEREATWETERFFRKMSSSVRSRGSDFDIPVVFSLIIALLRNKVQIF
ncbi:putative reverse transcriptase domain-containing protein [Tanacetum coccineum]